MGAKTLNGIPILPALRPLVPSNEATIQPVAKRFVRKILNPLWLLLILRASMTRNPISEARRIKPSPMCFEYERNTRLAYQNDRVAKAYHDLYTSRNGWRNLPARVVARRERRTIEGLARGLPHHKVLDLPAGTGKLAGLFASLGSDVVASDISESMLKLAKAEYAKIDYPRVSFMINDAINLEAFGRRQFDLVVCLRLLHRVPPTLRKIMLAQFARVAPYTIVSYGIENALHKARRSVRAVVFGGHANARCSCSMAEARAEVESAFEIVESAWIAPMLSQELIILLKSKPSWEHPAKAG